LFAVHDKNKLALLAKSWYKNIKTYTHPMKHIPIEDIRDYFGESVSFYFVFIEHYTKALYPFALVGKF
jgi:anoctamin-10